MFDEKLVTVTSTNVVLDVNCEEMLSKLTKCFKSAASSIGEILETIGFHHTLMENVIILQFYFGFSETLEKFFEIVSPYVSSSNDYPARFSFSGNSGMDYVATCVNGLFQITLS